jgi:hypothetical protein
MRTRCRPGRNPSAGFFGVTRSKKLTEDLNSVNTQISEGRLDRVSLSGAGYKWLCFRNLLGLGSSSIPVKWDIGKFPVTFVEQFESCLRDLRTAEIRRSAAQLYNELGALHKSEKIDV